MHQSRARPPPLNVTAQSGRQQMLQVRQLLEKMRKLLRRGGVFVMAGT